MGDHVLRANINWESARWKGITMKSLLWPLAVISAAAHLITTIPSASAFGMVPRSTDVSRTAVTQIVAPQAYKLGQLVLEAPWARATPEGAQVAGGYLKITNAGKEADRLIGGSLPLAASVEVHQMSMSDGVMQMGKMEQGLEIKPGQTVELKPGSYHLMFMGLREGLKQGQTIKGTLQFEKAGSIEVAFHVAPIGAKGAGTSGQMSHMPMQH
jgi:periplasmic copper chaperone A